MATQKKVKFLRASRSDNGVIRRVVLLVDLKLPYYAPQKRIGDVVDAEWCEPAQGSGGFMGWSVRIPYRESSAGSGPDKVLLRSLDQDEAEPVEWSECPTTAAYFARRLNQQLDLLEQYWKAGCKCGDAIELCDLCKTTKSVLLADGII